MMQMMLVLAALILLGCSTSEAPESAEAGGMEVEPVKTGAQVLVESGFETLAGKRVGLIVNHTARVGEAHLIDLVHDASNVTLAALFGPEHGLRGTEEDGVEVADGRDDRTGAPVYSLYGKTRKPTPAMLADLDVLVFDIQDVGARFYTFISTMGRSSTTNGRPASAAACIASPIVEMKV